MNPLDRPSEKDMSVPFELTRRCQCGDCNHVSEYQFRAGMTYYQSWYQACEKCGKKTRHYDERVMEAE